MSSNEIEMEEETENVEEDDDNEDKEDSSDEEAGEEKAYLPGGELEEGDELGCDDEAYIVYHQASLGPPCLSFDIIPQDGKFEFPLSVSCVAGTQAAKVTANNIIVFRMMNLHANKPVNNDVESGDEEEFSREEQPHLKMAGIKHTGCVNRVRYTCLGPTPVAAAWSETGTVSVWNLTTCLQKLDEPYQGSKGIYREEAVPLHAFSGHQGEGFALDWSNTDPGVLASGDCKKNIHLWRPQEGGTWEVDQRPYTSHTDSVEDIRWSPNEKNVMASCSCDRTIKIWDVRAAPQKACMLTAGNAHFSDINVIDWNPSEPFIVSGGDDGMVKIWDLRNFGGLNDPVATFKHHTAAITSVEWHRDDSTVFASSGEDNQVALWDLAIERDTSQEEGGELKDLPPQLLFIHQGLKDVKEIHWHPKVPGLVMSTSHTGFDVFRTISV